MQIQESFPPFSLIVQQRFKEDGEYKFETVLFNVSHIKI